MITSPSIICSSPGANDSRHRNELNWVPSSFYLCKTVNWYWTSTSDKKPQNGFSRKSHFRIPNQAFSPGLVREFILRPIQSCDHPFRRPFRRPFKRPSYFAKFGFDGEVLVFNQLLMPMHFWFLVFWLFGFQKAFESIGLQDNFPH